MKEQYVSAYEWAYIAGRPLPDVLRDLKDGTILYQWMNGKREIPLSQFYPGWKNL